MLLCKPVPYMPLLRRIYSILTTVSHDTMTHVKLRNASFSVLNAEGKEELISEFKAIYKKNETTDLVSQVQYLSRLAEHYEATAALNGNDWVNLLKVCDMMSPDCFTYVVIPWGT